MAITLKGQCRVPKVIPKKAYIKQSHFHFLNVFLAMGLHRSGSGSGSTTTNNNNKDPVNLYY